MRSSGELEDLYRKRESRRMAAAAVGAAGALCAESS